MAYVGPSLSEGRLSFATVYIGGYPPHIFSFDRKRTMVQTAFRAGSPKMNEAIQKTKEPGELMNILYNKAKEV
nr:MAG TPA: hypothetical protein [Caudoviricetes sp.]